MKKIFFLLLSLFMLIKCTNNPNSLTLKAGDQIMEKYVGEEFKIQLFVDNVHDLIGVAANITYDPNLVEVVDTDPGTPDTQVDIENAGFMPTATIMASVLKENNVEVPGTLVLGVTDLTGASYTGTGAVANIRFRATNVGTCNFVFDATGRDAQDLQGSIPVNWNDSEDLINLALATISINIIEP